MEDANKIEEEKVETTEENVVAEEVKDEENLPISDESDLEDVNTETENADDEFVEVVGDDETVYTEKEKEVK